VNSPFNGAGIFSDDPVAGAAKIAGLAQAEEQKGQFRTKSLRHLTETAPYFHHGDMQTLEEVVRFYNAGGGDSGFAGVKDPLMVPLNLSDSEIADLVAFLESLTGAPVDEALTMDTSAP
jgi:cytochrome c peroxidase